MGSLYERLTGTHATRPQIPATHFTVAFNELSRWRITFDEASDYIDTQSGEGLDTLERTEVRDLLLTVRTPDRLSEILDVLTCLETGMAGYQTPDALRARFEVPTR